MARSIVLRFPAQCFDCGSSLPAGATARWFGKGRVSCCGTDNGYPTPKRSHPADDMAKGQPAPQPFQALPPSLRRLAESLEPVSLPPSQQSIGPADANRAITPKALPPAARTLDNGLAAPTRFAGDYSPASLPLFAEQHPDVVMHVLLASGTELGVMGKHAQHVVRCIVESCVDRVIGFKVL